MITPVLMDERLLADIDQARRERDAFHLWWLGQSGYLVQWQDRHLLIDPYLSDSLTQKYANTDKPHVRMTARIIDPRRLDFIDVVSSSHNHTDHLDAETLIPLMDANPSVAVLVPEANRHFAAQRLGVAIDRLSTIDDGQAVHAAGFTFHGVAAAHESLERDAQGHCLFLGYVIQLGPWTMYHSGDTVLYDGLVERLRRWPIDLALLPINGRAAERRVAGNMGGHEAVALARQIGARMVVPCHYDMFQFNTATPDEFARAAVAQNQPHQVLVCGQRWTSWMLPGVTVRSG